MKKMCAALFLATVLLVVATGAREVFAQSAMPYCPSYCYNGLGECIPTMPEECTCYFAGRYWITDCADYCANGCIP